MMYFDAPRNLLIYKDPPEHLAQAIPEARALNGTYLAFPRTLRNSQVARHFGLPVVPLIDRSNYDWPRAPGFRPYEAQMLTTNFAVLHPRSFILNDLGTGKTLSALWAADYLMRQHPAGHCRAIIVAPLSTLTTVWNNAIFKHFLGRRTVAVLHGDPEQRLRELAKPVDFYIINFDGVGVGARTRKKFELDGFSRQLSEREDIKIAIIDEASAYRDGTTKRSRIARLVLGRRDYLWLMTGTPTPNAPTDAYGLAKMVNNAQGKSYIGFRDETMIRHPRKLHTWNPRPDGYTKARRLLSPAIHIPIETVWDAPPVTTQQREVALTDEQKKLMKQLKKDLLVEMKEGKVITAINEAAYRTKFLQISLGAIYDENHKWHAVDAEPRYSECEEVIEQAAHKIVVFCPLTSVIQRLYARLVKRWLVAVINGEVPKKERDDVILKFARDPDLRSVICDPGCVAHGINEFVAADTCLWFGAIDKGEQYTQGIGRLVRPGQKFPVTIVQLTSNALEREIFARLERQESMQGALLEAVRRGEL